MNEIELVEFVDQIEAGARKAMPNGGLYHFAVRDHEMTDREIEIANAELTRRFPDDYDVALIRQDVVGFTWSLQICPRDRPL